MPRRDSLAVLLAGGEVNLFSSISSTLRSLEEIEVDRVKVLHTPSGKRNAEKLTGIIPSIEMAEVPGDEASLSKRLSELKRHLSESDVVVISPAGASLSSVASKASSKVVHVTFPFGFWNGLVYPFVPRFLQRVTGIGDVKFRDKVDDVIENIDLEKVGLNNLGPIRREVAQLVKKLNATLHYTCNDLNCKKPSLKVTFDLGSAIGSVEVVTERDVTRITGAPMLKGRGVLARGQDSLLWLSGLLPLDLMKSLKGKPIIADTSFVLLGALNWVYKGFTIRVPRCVIYELIHKFEERAKRGDKVDLISLIAHDVVEEVKSLKIEYPSPPDLCDKAIMQIDPLLMDGNVLVTEDKNFCKIWNLLPLRKLMNAEPLERKREVRSLIEIRDDEVGFADRVYATLQFYALIKRALLKMREIGEGAGLRAEVDVEGRKLDEIDSRDSNSSPVN
ncbi:hypothetical protein [Ignicoccus islandicus]|nr:hypothetical protein [Ignicoccus islandicus]